MAVPLFDTRTPLAPLRDALAAKAAEVLDAGRYILGPEVAGFERDLAAHLGTEHVVGVANGTDALVLALRGMGVGPGDDVVVPSFTFYASAEAIAVIGANPVFCDIDPVTFCITPDTVRDALTPQTKVVMAVHLFGNVAPVDALGAARRAGARGRRAGARVARRRRPPRRHARRRRHLLVLPVEEPRRVRRRRRDRHRRTTSSPSRSRCCASTARATR